MEQVIQDRMVDAGGVAELSVPAKTRVLTLVSRRLPTDSIIGIPYLIRQAGDLLIVADLAKGPRFHLFNQKGEHVRSLGRWGRGPGEFESVMSVEVADSNSVLLYDYNLARITELDLDSLRSTGIWVRRTTTLSGRPQSIGRLSDGRVLTTNATDSALFGIIESTSGNIAPLSIRSFFIARDDSAHLKTAYEGRICGTNSKSFAVAFKFMSHVSISDAEKRTELSAEVPYGFRPTFVELPVVGRRTFKGGAPGVRLAYVDCVSTRRHIFALFSGRMQGKFKPTGDEYYGKFVHVFDWQGKLEAILALDHDAAGLSVVDQLLYTIDPSDPLALRVQDVSGLGSKGE